VLDASDSAGMQDVPLAPVSEPGVVGVAPGSL
jgi:hypothetical protein